MSASEKVPMNAKFSIVMFYYTIVVSIIYVFYWKWGKAPEPVFTWYEEGKKIL